MVRIIPPLMGRWPLTVFPDRVTIDGATFRKAKWRAPAASVVAQYREDVPFNSAHLKVHVDGTWRVDHADAVNPDYAPGPASLQHLLADHPAGKLAAVYSYASMLHQVLGWLLETE